MRYRWQGVVRGLSFNSPVSVIYTPHVYIAWESNEVEEQADVKQMFIDGMTTDHQLMKSIIGTFPR